MLNVSKQTKQSRIVVADKCTSWYSVIFALSLVSFWYFDILFKKYSIIVLLSILAVKSIHMFVLMHYFKTVHLIEYRHSIMFLRKTKSRGSKGYLLEFVDNYRYTNGWIVVKGVFFYLASDSNINYPLRYKKTLRIPNTLKDSYNYLETIKRASDSGVKGMKYLVKGAAR